MGRRILAAILSILLVAGLLLSRPTTAKADFWQETFDRYEALFAVTDDLPEDKFNTLYNVLQSEPGTFLNQLAFRDRDTKEYVLSILTGDWVSDESLRTMSALVSPMQFMQELTGSEKELSEDLQYHLNYTYHSRPRQHWDMETLFAQCMDVPMNELESFSTEVKYAFMEDPHTFIVKLAQEELNVRNTIAGDLLLYFEDTIPSLIVLDLLLLERDTALKNPDYYTSEELALLYAAINNTMLTPDPHTLSAPYTHELSLWIRQQEKADGWTTIIEQYDKLFDSGSYERLYTSLILDPETFVNQLAFRDAETKANVMYYLTGSWITPEQMKNMTQAVENLHTDLGRTNSESQLINAMREHFICADYQYLGIVTDFDELMEWVKTADPAGGFNELAFELACAVIGAPEAFLSQLAKEEEAMQDRVIELLQFHNGTYVATAVVNSINRSEAVYIPETSGLALKISTSLGCKGTPAPSDPDPEEYEKWLTEPPVDYALFFDYTKLFSNIDTFSLKDALLNDTRNFVKNLAYQDTETKQEVFDALTGLWLQDWELMQMYLCLEQHTESTVLNKSQTTLVEALMYHLDYAYCGRGQPHRDISVLFHEAETGDATMPARHDAFCRELKFAFLEDPYSFIVRLATEDEFVQSYVVQCLMSVNSNNDALIRRVYSKWIQEENADYYTEEQLEQIRQVTVSYLPILGEAPKPSDPDPEEYAQWLKDKGLLVDDPGVVLPIRPTETQPVTLPAETKPTAGEDPEKDTGWVSTVCFTLGFLCIGIATGSVIAKKKKAKKAKQDEALQQAAAEVPVKVYPKLLYCPAPLSRETQKQITLALREKYDEYSIHWYSIKETDGTCRCYGTDNGYDIIFYAGGLRMEIPDSHTVGSCTFSFATGFELYAHKDGQLTDLNTALKQGLVSQQAVQEALNKHKSITK